MRGGLPVGPTARLLRVLRRARYSWTYRLRRLKISATLPRHYWPDRNRISLFRSSPKWLEDWDKNKLLIFSHIPKSGGNSLNAYFDAIFGRHFLRMHTRLNWDGVAFVEQKEASELFCLSSHLRYPIHPFVGSQRARVPLSGDGLFHGRDLVYMTVLRDPVDRFISFYNFATSFPGHRHFKATRSMSIYEFYDHLAEIRDPELANHQCRLVTGQDRRSFELARESVVKNYFIAAPLHRLDDAVDMLARSLRLPAPPDLERGRRRNVSPKRAERPRLDESFLKKVRDANSEDASLFEFVSDRFEERFRGFEGR